MAGWLIRLVEWALPPGLGEAVSGDLAEEHASGASLQWLAAQAVGVLWRSLAALIARRVASLALLALVLAAGLECRRFTLTLIPFRESAEVGGGAFGTLTLLAAVAAAVHARDWRSLKGVALGTTVLASVPFLLGVPFTPGQLVVWCAAPAVGGAAAVWWASKGEQR